MTDLTPEDIADRQAERRLDAGLIFALLFLLAAEMGVLGFVQIPQQNQTLFAAGMTLINTVISGYAGYRWGSSASSQSKDKVIASKIGDGK